MSCNFRISPLLFKSHQAPLGTAEQWPCLHLPFLKILKSFHLVIESLLFTSSANGTRAFDNFDKFAPVSGVSLDFLKSCLC